MNAPDPLALLWSVLFGAGIGLLAAFCEALHIAVFPGKAARFLFDTALCLFAALSTFLLALAVSSGTLRFFQAGGELFGFALTRATAVYAVRRFLPGACRALERRKRRAENFFAEKKRRAAGKKAAKAEKRRKKSKKSVKKT